MFLDLHIVALILKKKTITRLYPVSLPPALISNFHFYNIANTCTVIFFRIDRDFI